VTGKYGAGVMAGKRRLYDRPKPGEWVLPISEGYQMECCDCGLVHTIDFRVVDGRAQMRMRRDKRATLMKRRHRFPDLFEDAGAEKEIADNSPMIMTGDSPDGTNVTVEGVLQGEPQAMKTLDNIQSTLKSAPTVEARAGTFIQEYSDVLLENVNNPSQLKQIVSRVISEKNSLAKTIAHV
jgi:hypothetical protein